MVCRVTELEKKYSKSQSTQSAHLRTLRSLAPLEGKECRRLISVFAPDATENLCASRRSTTITPGDQGGHIVAEEPGAPPLVMQEALPQIRLLHPANLLTTA